VRDKERARRRERETGEWGTARERKRMYVCVRESVCVSVCVIVCV